MRLRRVALAIAAALIAAAGTPAGALEPSAGTKNFTAPSSAPDYFTNESGPFHSGANARAARPADVPLYAAPAARPRVAGAPRRAAVLRARYARSRHHRVAHWARHSRGRRAIRRSAAAHRPVLHARRREASRNARSPPDRGAQGAGGAPPRRAGKAQAARPGARLGPAGRIGQRRTARHISGAMRRIAFFKMHGLGNDFVVLDARREPIAIDAAAARAVADRHTGIGCDQLIVIEPPETPAAQAGMRIINADGSEAEACGNASRCLAWLIAQETGRRRVRLETVAGALDAELLGDGRVSVDMGRVRTGWRDIPLARRMDTRAVDVAAGPLALPACSNIGNPHATFFVADAEAVDLATLGPVLEHHPLFPERTNIGVAAVCDREHIRLRVWERGAGLTRACGTGACAALVAAHRRGLTGRHAIVALDGGELDISWRAAEDDEAPGHVMMTGPAALTFEGSFDAALLGR